MGNTLGNGEVHLGTIEEALREEASQGDAMVCAQTYSHCAGTEIPTMVMSLAQIDEDADGRGDAGDVVDEGVGGNGNKEDEELGEDSDTDVANQSHVADERKTVSCKKQQKQKGSLDLEWHLAAFVYKAPLAGDDNQKGCWHQVLDDLYGNGQISQYPD